jgi:hypothetical protein
VYYNGGNDTTLHGYYRTANVVSVTEEQPQIVPTDVQRIAVRSTADIERVLDEVNGDLDSTLIVRNIGGSVIAMTRSELTSLTPGVYHVSIGSRAVVLLYSLY